MLKFSDITGVKYSVDDQTRKYVEKRLGRLDRYLPRHARKTAQIEVKLKQIDKSHGNKYEVDATLSIPEKTLRATDQAGNMLAAVDIVEAKLKGQIRRYRTESIPHLGKRRVLSRFKRSYDREAQ